MKRILATLFTILIFIGTETSFASGKLFLYPGYELKLKGESSFSEPEQYQWRVMQGKQEIATQSGQDFSFKFETKGEYRIDFTVTGKEGEVEQTHTAVVVAGDLNRALPLDAEVSVIPEPNAEGVVEVPADQPQILIYSGGSTGNIVRYQIDRDTTEDSDGDGNPENDIDNSNDVSLTSGSPWKAEIPASTKAVSVKVVVTDSEGATSTTEIPVRIIENTSDSNPPGQQPLEAIIHSFPPTNQDGVIEISSSEKEITFYFAESTGDIIQYRFDRNIKVDSDGDGKPDNDIDNKDHPSFTTGEALPLTFSRDDGQEQVVQLIAVSRDKENGKMKGSRIQRKIVFLDLKTLPFEERVPEMNPRLVIDQTQTATNAAVQFHVLGTPDGSSYQWDFDGDGTIDQRTEKSSLTHSYQEVGEYVAEVTVVYNSLELKDSQLISVREPEVPIETPEEFSDPIADFESVIEKNTVSFSNLSRSDPKLSEADFTFQWDFGDTNISTDKNPSHTYKEIGNYTVTLSVTDAQGVEAKKTTQIEVTELQETNEPIDEKNPDNNNPPVDNTNSGEPGNSENDEPPAQDDPTPPAAGTGGLPFVKIGLGFILLLLGGIGLLLFFRKVQHPELGFGEIVGEETERLFGKKPKSSAKSTAEASTEQTKQVTDTKQESAEEKTEAKPDSEVEDPQEEDTIIVEDQEDQTSTILEQPEQGPMPEWLKSSVDEQEPALPPAPEQPEQSEQTSEAESPPDSSDLQPETPIRNNQDLGQTDSEDKTVVDTGKTPESLNNNTSAEQSPAEEAVTQTETATANDELPEWLKGETTENGQPEQPQQSQQNTPVSPENREQVNPQEQLVSPQEPQQQAPSEPLQNTAQPPQTPTPTSTNPPHAIPTQSQQPHYPQQQMAPPPFPAQQPPPNYQPPPQGFQPGYQQPLQQNVQNQPPSAPPQVNPTAAPKPHAPAQPNPAAPVQQPVHNHHQAQAQPQAQPQPQPQPSPTEEQSQPALAAKQNPPQPASPPQTHAPVEGEINLSNNNSKAASPEHSPEPEQKSISESGQQQQISGEASIPPPKKQ